MICEEGLGTRTRLSVHIQGVCSPLCITFCLFGGSVLESGTLQLSRLGGPLDSAVGLPRKGDAVSPQRPSLILTVAAEETGGPRNSLLRRE